MLFLAHILNRPVVDADGIRIGWVEDLVLTGADLFPRVECIVLARSGKGAVFVAWHAVTEVSRRLVRLNATREHLPTIPLDDEALFLRRDILDKQVVDIHGRKVVRINDLQLVSLEHDLRLIGADIGARGLLRRLSLERPVRGMSRVFLGAELPERIIPWNYVEGLETEWPSVRLNVAQSRLRDLPATDIAAILTQVDPQDREGLLRRIDDETLADTLPYLEEDVQAELIEAMTDERASDILEILPPDDAADVLGELDEAHTERLLNLMEPKDAADLRELLQYGEYTAGGIMTTEYLAFSRTLTVAQVLMRLRDAAPDAETIYYLYVTDPEEHLEGVLSLRDLILASEETSIGELAQTDIIRVHLDDDQETVARTLNRYHLLAVPVVDADNVLHGIVTVDDVLDVMVEESEEDISRQAGALEESGELSSPWDEVRLRLPWLLGVGLASLAVSVLLLPQFTTFRNTLPPLLALLPLLLLLAVQIGSQSAVTAQVGLGQEESLPEIVRFLSRHQWPVGLLFATLAAIIGGGFAALLDGRAQAMAISASIWGIVLLNMLLGSFLPIALARAGIDPALVNRPALAIFTLCIGVPLLGMFL